MTNHQSSAELLPPATVRSSALDLAWDSYGLLTSERESIVDIANGIEGVHRNACDTTRRVEKTSRPGRVAWRRQSTPAGEWTDADDIEGDGRQAIAPSAHAGGFLGGDILAARDRCPVSIHGEVT